VQIQAALRFVAQRPQAGSGLAVVVQLGGVLNAQHHLVLRHARLTGLPVGCEHFVPGDLIVAQKPIGRRRFSPALAGPRDARRGLLPQPLSQQRSAPVQSLIAQIDGLEFFLTPAHA